MRYQRKAKWFAKLLTTGSFKAASSQTSLTRSAGSTARVADDPNGGELGGGGDGRDLMAVGEGGGAEGSLLEQWEQRHRARMETLTRVCIALGIIEGTSR